MNEQMSVIFDGVVWQEPANHFKNNAPGDEQVCSNFSFKKYPMEKVAEMFI